MEVLNLQANRAESPSTIKPFSVRREKFTEFHEMANYHYHGCYEIYYSLSGTRNLFYRDQFFRISKGDLVFINRLEPHRKSSTDTPLRERYLLYFNENIMDARHQLLQDPHCPFQQGSPILSLSLHDQQYVEALLDNIYKEYFAERSHHLAFISGLLTELLVTAIRCNEQRINQPKEEKVHIHPKVSKMIQYIQQHFMEPLTLDVLSSQFYISPYYLSRLFKSETGFSFLEYVAFVRMKEAQRLLLETEWNVERICGQVGYGNSAYFYKAFRKASGLSPVQFRKRHRIHNSMIEE